MVEEGAATGAALRIVPRNQSPPNSSVTRIISATYEREGERERKMREGERGREGKKGGEEGKRERINNDNLDLASVVMKETLFCSPTSTRQLKTVLAPGLVRVQAEA